MKKALLTILVLIYFSSFSFAQNEKEKKYKWGCGIGINSIQGQMGFPGGAGILLDENGNMTSGANRNSKSLSLSIIPKFFLREDLLIRLELGKTNIYNQYNEDYYESSIHYIYEASVKQNVTRFSPAIQWNYFRKKFFETYSGISFSYLNYGKYTDKTYREDLDSATNILKHWVSVNTTIDGGYATGIGAFAGFNIYLLKHISFGAEFSTSLCYYKVGGSRIVEGSEQTVPDPTFTSLYNWSYKYKGVRFSNILSSFNISLWF